MKLYFKYIILSIVILITNEAVFGYSVQNVAGVIKNYKYAKINNVEYINAKDAAGILLDNPSLDDKSGVYYDSDATFQIIPGTFYLVCKSGDLVDMLQMTMPTLKVKDNTVIPVKEFFATISKSSIYNVEFDAGIIYVSKKDNMLWITSLPKLSSMLIENDEEEMEKEFSAYSSNSGTLEVAFRETLREFRKIIATMKAREIKNTIRKETFEIDFEKMTPIKVNKNKSNQTSKETSNQKDEMLNAPKKYSLPENLIRRELDGN